MIYIILGKYSFTVNKMVRNYDVSEVLDESICPYKDTTHSGHDERLT